MTTAGEWQPAQYARFSDERTRPFFDLAALVERRAGMRVVDLGSGPGKLTAWLHETLAAGSTLGVDNSDAMLAEAAAHATADVRFQRADIVEFARACAADGTRFDLVFSNAALQWIDDHEQLLPAVAGLVAPDGQLAIQMPANDDHASHRVARALARDARFAGPLGGYVRPDPVRRPAWYAERLYRLGFPRQRVQLIVYPQVLPDTHAVVEWVKGSLLTAYRQRLNAETYAAFLEAYERALIEELGTNAPYFYAFDRVLMWASRTLAAAAD
ncbi:MAG: methyltransferase domain-containing protein [Chloroflexi bacterium]|nr:methyltransferase domain-containing protein [Chloroflexota bacterium]MDA1004519.1 methyltransferase domain-containing protein [Chloroflexota bacterium]